jgi:hypothetical protein
MNKFLTLLVVTQLLLLISLGYLLYKRPIQVVEVPARITKYGIVLECQKLTATRADDEFGYKSCIEELTKAAEEDLLKGVEKI